MPKCGKPKKDGTLCKANAMVGKDHCQHHKPETRPAPEIEVMTDPVADAMAEIMRLQKEQNYLISKLTQMRDEQEEIVGETSEELARERHSLSAEDLEKLQAATRLDFAKRAVTEEQKLDMFQRSLREEHRLSYTPTRDMIIPFGGIQWGFTAGAPSRYPKCVIVQYEEKCEKLNQRERAKARLSIDPEDDGREFGMEFKQMERALEANR